MSDLTPRIYAKNSKLYINTRNKYDTVQFKPIPNAIKEAPESVYNANIIAGNTNGVNYTLPLGTSGASTFIRTMYSRYVPINTEREFAKARIEVTVMEGEQSVVLDEPISGIPTLDVSVTGRSYVVDPLAKSYEDIPSVGELTSTDTLVAWAMQHGTEKRSLRRSYDSPVVSLNPWVSKIHVYPKVTPDSDIVTKWMDDDSMIYEATLNSWTDNSIGNATSSGPYNVVALNAIDHAGRAMSIKDQSITLSNSVQKISDTQFKIKWQVVARYVYMAASRKRTVITGTWSDIDNLVYVDMIDTVNLRLSAVTRNTEPTLVSYSLDAVGNLSTIAKNNKVYSTETNELSLLDAHYSNNKDYKWIPDLAEAILNSCKNGKYIFECEVPAKWAVEQSVKLRDRFYVVLQNGEYVMREGKKVLFEIMNITKYFAQDKFVYRLKLLQYV